MMNRNPSSKPRVRLYHLGKATYRLVSRDRGWGGRYGNDRRPAKWVCLDCHAMVDGTDERPEPWDSVCARNGHAPCRVCGQRIPRLNCGCPREHRWNQCPGKTEDDKVQAQHAHKGHLARPERAS